MDRRVLWERRDRQDVDQGRDGEQEAPPRAVALVRGRREEVEEELQREPGHGHLLFVLLSLF